MRLDIRTSGAAALVLAGAFSAGPLAAAPEYSVGFMAPGDNSVTSAVPFGRDSSFALIPSNGSGVATAQGYAMEGRVGATHAMDITWSSGFSGAFSSATYAKCKAEDLIISGPAGPATVAASLNLRLQSAHSLEGGFPGNGAHQARVAVAAIARQAFWPFGSYAQIRGDYLYTNAGPFSNGVLAGQSGPILDVPLTLSGNFPVNVPFSVELRVDATDAAYGNVFTNPGFTGCDAGGNSADPFGAGLRLASVDGEIMTLPDGYTLNSPSWGIVNNGSALVGVDEAAMPGRPRLELAGANPFVLDARVSLDLPRAASARVAVFDVAGRAVRVLVDGVLPAGRRDVRWDGRDSGGATVSAGIYFVRAECEGERLTARLARVR